VVELRFYIDSETGEPHLHRHGVTELEATDVLERPFEDRIGAHGARIAVGRTRGGRYLRVVYVPDPRPDSIFVITAYELGPKARRALQRRRKRKK
jgi:hypothetical protein